MSWSVYAISLGAGLGVGVLYGLIEVRSPAPPIIALLGLLGMLAGESLVSYWRGHPDVLAKCLHLKSFSVAQSGDGHADQSRRTDPNEREHSV